MYYVTVGRPKADLIHECYLPPSQCGMQWHFIEICTGDIPPWRHIKKLSFRSQTT